LQNFNKNENTRAKREKIASNTMQSFDTREQQKELHVYDMCELSSMKACC
jgi:hypothetical protein